MKNRLLIFVSYTSVFCWVVWLSMATAPAQAFNDPVSTS